MSFSINLIQLIDYDEFNNLKQQSINPNLIESINRFLYLLKCNQLPFLINWFSFYWSLKKLLVIWKPTGDEWVTNNFQVIPILTFQYFQYLNLLRCSKTTENGFRTIRFLSLVFLRFSEYHAHQVFIISSVKRWRKHNDVYSEVASNVSTFVKKNNKVLFYFCPNTFLWLVELDQKHLVWVV